MASLAEVSAQPADGQSYAFRVKADGLQLVRRNGDSLPETDLTISLRALDFGNGPGCLD